jgi:hypothetical protein
VAGVTLTVALNNLREEIWRPGVDESAFKPVFAAMLKHYGSVAIPCRVRNPNRKGKAGTAVGQTQRTPIEGLQFERLCSCPTPRNCPLVYTVSFPC